MSLVREDNSVDAKPASTHRSDEDLVRDCLNGGAEAWSELLDKYKNLIFSVPVKYGFSRDEAADVFQEVCLGLLSELQKLREPRALPKWLLTVAAHKCFHRRRHAGRVTTVEPETLDALAGEVPAEAAEIIDQAEQEQALREGIAGLPPRCQRLVKMLFYETAARPYRDVAQELGIAVGSIGFFRQSCLDRLRKALGRLEAATASSASRNSRRSTPKS
jgi:RNA polymerase sigma factor (sigma-70 family)